MGNSIAPGVSVDFLTLPGLSLRRGTMRSPGFFGISENIGQRYKDYVDDLKFGFAI